MKSLLHHSVIDICAPLLNLSIGRIIEARVIDSWKVSRNSIEVQGHKVGVAAKRYTSKFEVNLPTA
jgi:hypothetical protein